MRLVLVALLLMASSACTTVKYNGSDTVVKKIDFPEIGVVHTVYIGDHLIKKGVIAEEKVLVVHKLIDGVSYDIPALTYPQIGFDDENDFYSSAGVSKNPFADPFRALSLKKEQGSKLCVVTVFGNTACYEGQYDRKTQMATRGSSFQQTLIYSGRVGNKINISYREFSNNTARPAFNNDVEYDLSSSRVIGYKGASIEVLKADNSSITYKLIKNFP